MPSGDCCLVYNNKFDVIFLTVLNTGAQVNLILSRFLCCVSSQSIAAAETFFVANGCYIKNIYYLKDITIKCITHRVRLSFVVVSLLFPMQTPRHSGFVCLFVCCYFYCLVAFLLFIVLCVAS